MKRINYILFSFLLFVVLSFIGFWKLLQTEYIAQQISSRVSLFVSKKVSSDIKFERLEFNLFPAGITLHNVSLISDHAKIKELELHANKINVSMNPLDLISNRFVISEVVLEDGAIYIDDNQLEDKDYFVNQGIIHYLKTKISKIPESEDTEWVKKLKNFKDSNEVYQLLYQNLPIFIVKTQLKSFYINRNQDDISVDNLELVLKKNNIDLNFNLKYIDPTYLSQSYYDQKIDQIDGGIRFQKNKIKVNSLHLISGLSSCSSHGYINEIQAELSKLNLQLKNQCEIDLERLSYFSRIHEILGVKEGIGKLQGTISGKYNNLKIVQDAVLEDFISNVADSKIVKSKLSFIDEVIRIDSGSLKSDQQYLVLNKGFELINFKKDKMVSTPIDATFYNIPSHNFLKSILNITKPLYGEFNGRIEVSHESPNFYFKALTPIRVNNFKLSFDKENSKNQLVLLKNNFIELYPSLMTYQYESNDFSIDAKLGGNGNNVVAKGHVNSKEVDFELYNSTFNLDNFKEIAGVSVGGKLIDNVSIVGPLENVIFNFKGQTNELTLFGLKLGKVDHEFEYRLATNSLHVLKTEGLYKKSNYKGAGELNFNTDTIKLDYDISKTNYNDIIDVLSPLIKDIPYLPNDIWGDIKGNLSIGGKIGDDSIVYDGNFQSKSLQYLDEYFKSIRMNIHLEDNVLKFNNINLIKEVGSVRGDYLYNLNSKDYSYNFYIDRISIDEFNFLRNSPILFNADLWGELKGGKEAGKSALEGSLNLRNSNFKNIKLDNSRLVFNMQNENLTYDLKFLGENLTSQGEIYLDHLAKANSKIEFNTNITNPSVFFSSLFGRWLKLDDFTGKIITTTDFSFTGSRFENVNAKTFVRDFDLIIKNKRFQNTGSDNVLTIENGYLQFLDFVIQGPNTKFSFIGEGDFKKGLIIKIKSMIDASILETILKDVVASSGKIQNTFEINLKENQKIHFDFNSKSDDLFLHFEKIPTIFNKITYSISGNEDRISFDQFEAMLNSGKLKISGDIFNVTDSVYPKINLNYNLEQAGFTYLGKTSGVVNGKGSLAGTTPPYLLNGDLNFIQGNSFNELEDFIPKEKSLSEYDKFLPVKKGILKSDLLQFDLNVETLNPVYMKNTTGEVNMNASLLIKGNPSQPKVGGRVNLIPGSSRFFFKSNDFILSRGFVLFFEDETDINPEIDLFASSSIADYLINMRIFGRAKNFNIDLSSEPALSQNDILSLMTLGYTNDLSQNLASSDRNAIAQAGIGGLIFDRFKISEGLKNSLGLRLSVSPEFREGAVGGSMLQGRGSTNTGSSGINVRSGTKVELRKKISEKVDLAVSSTVGASIGQRQSMNLNYNFNKSVGAEGVYEIRTNDEGVEDVIATSLGGDLKFKWNFK